MPSPTPVEIASYAANAAAGANPKSIATTTAVSAGDAILVALNIYTDSTSFTSVTDDASNTYAFIRVSTGNNFSVVLAYCLSAAALSSGQHIIVTQTGAPTQYLTLIAAKVAGGLASIDRSFSGTVASSSSLSIGPTAGTFSAVELVIGMFGVYGGGGVGTLSAGTGDGYTLVDAQVANTSDGNGCLLEYLVTSTTGPQTATGACTTTPDNIGGVVATFKYPVVVDPYPAGYPMPSRRDWAGYRMHHRERLNRRPSGLYTFGGGA